MEWFYNLFAFWAVGTVIIIVVGVVVDKITGDGYD